MRNPNRRSAGIGRVLALVLLALIAASPAWAQFGAIKKALKGKAADKAVETAAPESPAPQETGAAAPAGGGDNSTVVLNAEALDRLLAGYKAAQAEREKAAKEDTPNSRYLRAKAAYEAATAKCEQAKSTYATRLAADEKMQKRSQYLLDKMLAASEKQDTKAQEAYGDSISILMDPSCAVKSPKQPDNYWEDQRAIDARADEAVGKTSGYNGRELAMMTEKIIAILQHGEVPGGTSPSEVSAVKAKGPELKAALGIRDAQEGRVAKQAPAPAPAAVADTAPTPTPAVAPTPSAGMGAMNACMAANAQKYQKQLEDLGKKADQAQKAKNQAALMAIADSSRKLTMAGCGAGY